jgi:hypothetical protein
LSVSCSIFDLLVWFVGLPIPYSLLNYKHCFYIQEKLINTSKFCTLQEKKLLLSLSFTVTLESIFMTREQNFLYSPHNSKPWRCFTCQMSMITYDSDTALKQEHLPHENWIVPASSKIFSEPPCWTRTESIIHTLTKTV